MTGEDPDMTQKIVAFPKKKRTTPNEFQDAYEKRWRKSTLLSAACWLGMSLLLLSVLMIWGPAIYPEVAGVEFWKLLFVSGAPCIVMFIAFYEPRPSKGEGERTRKILDNR